MSHHHLSAEERIELGALRRVGLSQRKIGLMLGYDHSTIGRELRRNTRVGKEYRTHVASRLTRERRHYAKQVSRKIEHNYLLEDWVESKLLLTWSPEQISGWLKTTYGVTLHFETIYQYIYRNAERLSQHLRFKRSPYRRCYGTGQREQAREAAKKRRIDTRPGIIERRERVGDWEGDFIRGREPTIWLMTHTERKSGFELITPIVGKTSEHVYQAAIESFKDLPLEIRQTITYDNDLSLADHELIERQTGATVYFAYPHHPWERGTNENTNGLLREFFPKKRPFATITTAEIKRALWLLNNRPRKRHDYKTPAEIISSPGAFQPRI